MARLIRAPGCASKHLYRSRKAALGAAGNVVARRAGTKLYAYHCHDCHGYHLTKLAQR